MKETIVHGRPTLAVRFDIAKLGLENTELSCWRFFWHAIPPTALKGMVLYEGAESCGETYTVAIQAMDAASLQPLMTTVSMNDEYQKVAATDMFKTGDVATSEQLIKACEVDIFGACIVEPSPARSAFEIMHAGKPLRGPGENVGRGSGDVGGTIGSSAARAMLAGQYSAEQEAAPPEVNEEKSVARTKLFMILFVVATIALVVVAMLMPTNEKKTPTKKGAPTPNAAGLNTPTTTTEKPTNNDN